MGIKYLDKKVFCPVCDSGDTQAILDENKVGIIWCCCGQIIVRLTRGMQVQVVRHED